MIIHVRKDVARRLDAAEKKSAQPDRLIIAD